MTSGHLRHDSTPKTKPHIQSVYRYRAHARLFRLFLRDSGLDTCRHERVLLSTGHSPLVQMEERARERAYLSLKQRDSMRAPRWIQYFGNKNCAEIIGKILQIKSLKLTDVEYV